MNENEPADTVPDEATGDASGGGSMNGSSRQGQSASVALVTVFTATIVNASTVGTSSVVAGQGSPLQGTVRMLTATLEQAGTDQWRYLGSVLQYSRFDDSDPLAHESRREIYHKVETDPGVHLSELANATDASLSTVRHHLRILDEENLISSQKVHGNRCYYRGDAISEVNIELRIALEKSTTRRLLERLADRGAAQTTTLADDLDRDPSTVSHHLSTLEESGLVVRDRDGAAVMTRLAPSVERTLKQR
jgi:DNA-binding transcriptional ArsR family regulator